MPRAIGSWCWTRPATEWPSGAAGRDPGELDTPLGLSVGLHDGNVYVADSGNMRVQWWSPAGQPRGILNLDNTAGPGGVPYDVAATAQGEVLMTVDRGVLRFRYGAYANTIRPSVLTPEPVGVATQHEGVRRLAVNANAGFAFTYAPDLWSQHGADTYPARWFAGQILGPGGSSGAAPYRVAGGGGDVAAVALDSSRRIPRFDPTGQVTDRINEPIAHPFNLRATDLTADPGCGLAPAGCVTVLLDNTTGLMALSDPVGPPVLASVLEPDMMTRRDKTGERVADGRWWNVAVAQRSGIVAVLNAGYQQLVMRDLDGLLLTALTLNPPTAPFRTFRDLAYDPSGTLWILARDGHVLAVDARGRPRDKVTLTGVAPRGAEARPSARAGPSSSSPPMVGPSSWPPTAPHAPPGPSKGRTAGPCRPRTSAWTTKGGCWCPIGPAIGCWCTGRTPTRFPSRSPDRTARPVPWRPTRWRRRRGCPWAPPPASP